MLDFWVAFVTATPGGLSSSTMTSLSVRGPTGVPLRVPATATVLRMLPAPALLNCCFPVTHALARPEPSRTTLRSFQMRPRGRAPFAALVATPEPTSGVVGSVEACRAEVFSTIVKRTPIVDAC